MELEVFNKKELTDNEEQFIDLHNRIIVSAKLTADYLYDFCNQLKQMRDEKIYKYVGLKTFEEYAVEVLGLKKSQAYNFCSIADNVSDMYLDQRERLLNTLKTKLYLRGLLVC